MELEKRLAFTQNTYAASIAETVNTYQKLGVLDDIVAQKREKQAQTAPYVVRQLGIETVEQVFTTLADVFGCANWTVEKAGDGYIASATVCKLCALSKRMGGANPCYGWCIDPMVSMINAVTKGEIGSDCITVKSTLIDGDCCQILLRPKEKTKGASE